MANTFAPCGTTIRAARRHDVWKFTAVVDERWSVDQDWNPDDDNEDRVIIGVERDDGEPETDDGESEADQVTIVLDAAGVVHKGARGEQEPPRNNTRNPDTNDSPTH